MKLDAADLTDLQPLIAATVRATIAELDATDRKLPHDRLAYSEAEASALLGVERYVLRDARLRGAITARKLGKSFRYSRASLVRWLEGSDA